jgi:TonB family protein
MAQTAPAGDAPMRPKGAWTAEFEESTCVLSRNYGEGAAAMQLAFRPDPSDGFLEIVVVAPHAGKGHARSGEAEAVLQPSGQRGTGFYRDYTVAGGKRVLRFSVKRDAISDLATATSIRLTRGGEPPLHFALSNTANAMKTIQTCQDDLMRRWGFDPAALRTLVRRAEPDGSPLKWITPSDYPAAALRAGQQGEVRFRLIIDAEGGVADCRIDQTSGHKLLDDTACMLLRKRARFIPAVGADGKPVRVPWSSRFVWLIPDRPD